MEYHYLLGMITNYETARIKAFRGKYRTASERIPNAFALLVPEIIKILEKNIDQLCNPDQGILILGMQPAGTMLKSEQDIDRSRTVDGLQPDYHFCCTMDYLVIPLKEIDQQHQWKNAQSVVIDFTAGTIMDIDYYFAQVAKQKTQGTVFGRINSRALALTWAIVNIREGKSPRTQKPAKKDLPDKK